MILLSIIKKYIGGGVKRLSDFSLKKCIKANYKSVVEFYLVDAFEIYHYLPIYDALQKAGVNCSIVAEPPQINTAGSWFDFKTAVKILKAEGIKYTTKSNPMALLAVTTQYARNLSKYCNYKAQLQYGVGAAEKTAFQIKEDVSKEFDFQFVNGNFNKEIIDALPCHAKTLVVGYPKHLQFFESGLTKTDILDELSITTNKPILLYLPTWDEYSSIEKYSDAIALLKNYFFVVSKPHHCTQRLNEKHMKLLNLCSDLILDANYSFYKAVSIADAAVVDGKSGASTEVPYLYPTVRLFIVVGIQNDEKYILDHKKLGYVCSSPEDLLLQISKSSDDNFINNERKPYLKYLYSVSPSVGIERIVSLVKDLILE